MTLEEIFKSKRFADCYILSRYFYRIGEPIINDSTYEILEKALKSNPTKELQEYFNRTYDDDPIPIRLLNEIGIDPVESSDDSNEWFQYLNGEKSLSINSVTSYKEAFEFFSEYRILKQDLMTSIKLDGNNVKSLYMDGDYKISLSRGRSGGVSFNFTNTVKHVFPKTIETDLHEVKLYAEAFVDEDYLPTLRSKYKADGYKTAKSAAISLLRVEHAPEDYKHLNITVHGIEGLADTLDKAFDQAADMGFTVVKHKLVPYGDIPEDFDKFKSWLKREIFDYFEREAAGNPSDGIVVEVNDMKYTGIQAGQYTNRQLALKFEQWSFKCYKGIVEDILWEQKRVNASCRIKIRPMKTDDGCNANFINAFNFSILVDENINIGSEIYYVRNSGAVNILVYGETLNQMLGR